MTYLDSLVKTLAFIALPESEQIRVTKLEQLEEELADLNRSARFNKEQWQEELACGHLEHAGERETKYKERLVRIKQVKAEMRLLRRGA